MNKKKLCGIVSSVLFAFGEPLQADKLCEVASCSMKALEEAVSTINEGFAHSGIGLAIIRLNDKYQMGTCKEYAQYIKDAMELKKKAPLSNAAFEVLSIIAYNQPVTKSFIEQVRGVDCSGVVNTLVEKELIEERGRLELPGRPLLYGTTDNFLRCFTLESLDDLPPLPKDEESEDEANELESASDSVEDIKVNDDNS